MSSKTRLFKELKEVCARSLQQPLRCVECPSACAAASRHARDRNRAHRRREQHLPLDGVPAGPRSAACVWNTSASAPPCCTTQPDAQRLQGPVGTPYEGGTFQVAVNVPQQYPLSPPAIKFVTKVRDNPRAFSLAGGRSRNGLHATLPQVFHPNVHWKARRARASPPPR